MVDRVALEMRSTRKRTGGSNPSLSAILRPAGFGWQATEGLQGARRLDKPTWYVCFIELSNGAFAPFV